MRFVNVSERVRHLSAAARALLRAALLTVFLLTTHAAAQSAGGWVSGTVLDEDGAVITGAAVTAFNPATGLERRAVTNGEGYFSIPLLPAGVYSITVQRDGFKTVDVRDVTVSDASRPALRVRLTVGDVREYVVVTALSAEGVGGVGDDGSASVSMSFGASRVESLPLNGNSLQSLINLVPGAVVTKTNFNEQGQLSFNGQRANANYFTVDGVSANFGVSAGPAPGQSAGGSLPALASFGGTNNLVAAEAVQELRVQTFTYAAEFGRTPGGQVAVFTRAGTDEFHGAAFYNLRRRALDADDWFVNARGLRKPPSRHDDVGGVLGGPVVRGQTFFFLSYEWLSLLQPRVALAGVPSAATRSRVPAQLKPLVNAFPLPQPTGRDLGFGMKELAASYGEPSRLWAGGVRVDQIVSKRVSLFGRYTQSPSRTAQRGSPNAPTATARDTFGAGNQFRQSLSTVNESSFETRTLTLGSSAAVGPRVSVDARFNWSRARGSTLYRLDDFGGAAPPPASYFFPSTASPGDALVQVVSVMPLGESGNLRVGKDADNNNSQLNAASVWNVTRGAHRFKLGADYRRLSPAYDAPAYTQTVTFQSFGDAPGLFATVVSGTAGDARIYAEAGPREMLFQNLSLFAQDEWRIGPRLTVSYGLRWELNPPPRAKGDTHPAVLRHVLSSRPELAAAGTPLWETTYGNFAPRLGAAYRLRRWPGATLRVGAGLFYDLGAGQGAQAFGSVFPFTRLRRLGLVSYPLKPADAEPPAPSATPGTGTLFAFDPRLKLPRVYQWSVAFERPLGAEQSLSLAYLGAQGRRLLREDVLQNRRVPGGSNADTIVYMSNAASSDYQALQAQFSRRLSRGLEGFASYTFARSTDTASDDSSLRFSSDGDRGPSNFDVRHSLSAAFTYQLPPFFKRKLVGPLTRNWSADALVRWRGATPVDITTASSLLSGGLVQYSRPALVNGVPVYIKDSNAPGGMYINPRAFTAAPGAGGRLGRNALRGFGASQVDLTLRRAFEPREGFSLQLRAEIYNLFNHPNFENPAPVYAPSNDPVLADPSRPFVSTQTLGQSLGTGGTFGGLIPMYQLGGPRAVQLGVKLRF